jgi:DNA-binding MarR family transcriptional regulator
MDIGQELKSSFSSEIQKAHVNILFSAAWLRSRLLRLTKSFGLTPEQYNVLRILRGSYPNSLCVKNITGRMIDRNSNTTRIIDKLERKNLAKRVPSKMDRRELEIYITEEGLTLLTAIDNQFTVHDPNGSGLSDKEAALLSNLLDKMRMGA